MVLVVKNLPANAGEVRDTSSVPGLGKSPRGGNGNPLQYSCLGNSMDRGAWWATVPEVAKSWTQQTKQATKATRVYSTTWGTWSIFYNYKWSITFKILNHYIVYL